jgi:hypothetical protein
MPRPKRRLPLGTPGLRRRYEATKPGRPTVTKTNVERLRELANECVRAANETMDVDAASALMHVASSLIELAMGKVPQATNSRTSPG